LFSYFISVISAIAAAAGTDRYQQNNNAGRAAPSGTDRDKCNNYSMALVVVLQPLELLVPIATSKIIMLVALQLLVPIATNAIIIRWRWW